MEETLDKKPEPGRNRCAEARRQQILDAAAHCFREHGFHNAGMQLIARTAGMSAGHIYHYFENKEAIIAAIVAADEAISNSRFDGFRRAQDVARIMVEQADLGLARSLDAGRSALLMEIMAESGRNERIAALVRESDASLRRQLVELMARIGAARGEPADPESARRQAAQAELVLAVFDGLRVRAVRHPALDQEAVLDLLRQVLQRILAG